MNGAADRLPTRVWMGHDTRSRRWLRGRSDAVAVNHDLSAGDRTPGNESTRGQTDAVSLYQWIHTMATGESLSHLVARDSMLIAVCRS